LCSWRFEVPWFLYHSCRMSLDVRVLSPKLPDGFPPSNVSFSIRYQEIMGFPFRVSFAGDSSPRCRWFYPRHFSRCFGHELSFFLSCILALLAPTVLLLQTLIPFFRCPNLPLALTFLSRFHSLVLGSFIFPAICSVPSPSRADVFGSFFPSTRPPFILDLPEP